MHEALSCYHKAIRLEPTHASAYNNMANALKRTEGSQLSCGGAPCTHDAVQRASISSLRTVISLNPKHANAYTNLASLMRSRNQLSECIALNRIAVSIEPRHTTAYENLGRALQAVSAPRGTANTVAAAEREGGEAEGEGAWFAMSSSGGVRHRARLEESAAAFRTSIDLLGDRARPDARRGEAYALLWLGLSAEARAALRAGVSAGVWANELQSPGEFTPALPSAPFPDTSRVSCVPRLLESRATALIGETRALLARSAALESSSGDALDGGWHPGLFRKELEGLHSPRDGFANYDVMRACSYAEKRLELPQMCAALDELREKTDARVELMRLSRLHAGVSIGAHTGLRNTRWRCHLGLVVPEAYTAHLVVGGTPIQWKAGKAFVFDDSYEHTVVWDEPTPKPVDLSADTARVVLIVDFAHPGTVGGAGVCPG